MPTFGMPTAARSLHVATADIASRTEPCMCLGIPDRIAALGESGRVEVHAFN
jgi:hypothetical protein